MSGSVAFEGDDSRFELGDGEGQLDQQRVDFDAAANQMFGADGVKQSTRGVVLSAEAVEGLAEAVLGRVGHGPDGSGVDS